MKYRKVFITLCIFIAPVVNAQAYTQDVGKITTLYINNNGVMGFSVESGVPNANAEYSCGTGVNGFVGSDSLSVEMKSAILAAKTAGQTIRVIITGCYGNWFQLSEIYVL